MLRTLGAILLCLAAFAAEACSNNNTSSGGNTVSSGNTVASGITSKTAKDGSDAGPGGW